MCDLSAFLRRSAAPGFAGRSTHGSAVARPASQDAPRGSAGRRPDSEDAPRGSTVQRPESEDVPRSVAQNSEDAPRGSAVRGLAHKLLTRFLTHFLILTGFLTGSSQVSHRFLTGFSQVSHKVSHRFLTGFSQPQGAGPARRLKSVRNL